jgi:hypothetical protein
VVIETNEPFQPEDYERQLLRALTNMSPSCTVKLTDCTDTDWDNMLARHKAPDCADPDVKKWLVLADRASLADTSHCEYCGAPVDAGEECGGDVCEDRRREENVIQFPQSNGRKRGDSIKGAYRCPGCGKDRTELRFQGEYTANMWLCIWCEGGLHPQGETDG